MKTPHKARITQIRKDYLSHCVHGIKKGEKPFGALYGGNGTFCVQRDTYLLVQVCIYDLGNKCIWLDVYNDYKKAAGIKRISPQRLEQIKQHIGDKITVYFDDSVCNWECAAYEEDAWSMNVRNLL